MKWWETATHIVIFWLRRECLYGLYARDTRRYEVVQVVCGEDGAHRVLGAGWGGKTLIS
jgi:hypothetical protein